MVLTTNQLRMVAAITADDLAALRSVPNWKGDLRMRVPLPTIKGYSDLAFMYIATGGAVNCLRAIVNEIGCAHLTSLIEVDSDQSMSALHSACGRNEIGVLNVMLSYDALDVNVRDSEDFTPLMMAIRWRQPDAVRRLLTRPDVNVNLRRYADGPPILYMALQCYTECPQILDLLLADPRVDVNALCPPNRTILCQAITCTCTVIPAEAIVKLIEHKSIDVNNQSTSNFPLFAAVKRNQTAIVAALLRHKEIDVCQRPKSRMAPIMEAVGLANVDIVKLLLAHKDCYIEEPCCMGGPVDSNMPQMAVIRNDFDIMVAVLRHPRMDNLCRKLIADNNGQTCLMIAANLNMLHAMRAILSCADDVKSLMSCKDEDGKTAMDVASKKGRALLTQWSNVDKPTRTTVVDPPSGGGESSATSQCPPQPLPLNHQPPNSSQSQMDAIKCVNCHQGVRQVNILCRPCNHLCLCGLCATTLKKDKRARCPMCLQAVKRFVRVYF